MSYMGKTEENRFIEESKRGLFHIIFGRSVIIILLLLIQFLYLFAVFYGLKQYIPYTFGGTVAFTAVMLVFILNTKENPTIKLSWCIVIAVIPAFGTLLYWLVRLDIGHRLEQKVIQSVIEEGSRYAPQQEELKKQLYNENRALYNLASYTEKCGGYPIYQNTEVKYLPMGEQKFEEMLVQLEKAEKFIFLEYFIIDKGYMWGKILEILARKAQEGVEVRVMYDGTCAITSLPYRYPKVLEKMGIRCKMFSPIHPFISTHYNNRDHRKILVIDGKVAFTGGINLADEYINRRKLHGHWKDASVMIKGDAVNSFTLMFLQMWNAMEKERIYEPYLLPAADSHKYKDEILLPNCKEKKGYVLPYGDSPLDDENVGEQIYLDIINQAENYVYIMTPYLILDNEMVSSLVFAAKRGIDVRIILPHIPDKKYVFALAKSHYKELVNAGVKLYEYTPGFVHAKVFISDDKKAVVGTINLDYRSLYLHFECAVYLYMVPAIEDILKDFRETQELCQRVTREAVCRQPIWIRFTGAVLKVIAPLM